MSTNLSKSWLKHLPQDKPTNLSLETSWRDPELGSPPLWARLTGCGVAPSECLRFADTPASVRMPSAAVRPQSAAPPPSPSVQTPQNNSHLEHQKQTGNKIIYTECER